MRMFTAAWIGAVAAVLSLPATAAAQIQIIQGATSGDPVAFPGMMPGRPVKTGTGRIRGRVVAAETGNPLRRAQVRITGPDIGSRASLTDGDGRFEFRELPAGRFNLQATKSGYVSVSYGQTRPFESGRPIELSDKQVLENADITMPRGSVISGRILDEFGEPVPDAMVMALRQSWSNGRRRLIPAGGRTGQTNDLGQFRIFGLPPGEYYISATLRSGAETMAFEMMMAAAPGGGPGPSGSNPTSGYAPTYFPGTASVAEAQKITLVPGQEAGADFGLLPVRLARISGIAMSSEGKPLEGAMVQVLASAREAMLLPMASSARTSKEGTFTLNGVPPGEYTLQIRSMQVTTMTDGGGNNMVFTARLSTGGDGETEAGSLPVSVAGEDISNLVLQTSRGGTASGRVTFEDGAKAPSGGSLRVSAMPTDPESGMMIAGSTGAVKPDGAFEVKGLTGHRLFRVPTAAPGLTLKSVKLNGVDVTDAGVDFKSGESISGLEVVLTARATSVTGSVIGSDGAPLKDYTVVIFSDDPDQWRLPMTRWVTGTRPDQDGRFKVQNLPPGTFYAVAIDYVPQGEWGDPELLDRLRSKGKRFILDEGGTQTLDLKLSEGY